MLERVGCASKAWHVAWDEQLHWITLRREEEKGQRKRKGKRERERVEGKNEMKELQMRDFPVRRINQQTMNSTAQSLTPRLRTRASPSTHTHAHKHTRGYTHVLSATISAVATFLSHSTYTCVFKHQTTASILKEKAPNLLAVAPWSLNEIKSWKN